MKHFFFIIFTCVYLKGMRVFNTVHWEGHDSDIWDFFLCLLQTFLINIMSGVKGRGGGCHLCSNPFCYQRNKSYGWKTFVALDAGNGLWILIQAAATLERTCRLFLIWWCLVKHHRLLLYHVDATGSIWSCMST